MKLILEMNLTTVNPYWLINSELVVPHTKLEKSGTTDIVIVGSGISGALTAYYLTNAGYGCILVDSGTIGLVRTWVITSHLQYEIHLENT